MFSLKILLLALCLLATNILAVRVTYSAKFTGQKASEHTQRLDTVDDDKGVQILEHMFAWSGGKYMASRVRVLNMILVVNVEAAESKGRASEMIQQMVSIVSRNYNPNRRSLSLAPSTKSRSRSARNLKARSAGLERRMKARRAALLSRRLNSARLAGEL